MGRTNCVPGLRPARATVTIFNELSRLALMAALGLFLSNSLALAQPAGVQPGVVEREYEDNVPPRPAAQISIPSVEAPRAWDEAQGIRFLLNGVNIEGNAVLDDQALGAPFRDLVGKEVSIGQIFAATQEITQLYDRAGFALSLAYVPAQDVKAGIVLVRVVEGFVGDVAINDSGAAPNGRWRSYAESLMASRPLKTAVLERYLLLISDLAGVKATNFFERMKNAEAGAMRLVINVDRKSVDARVELNNRGSKAIGPIRAFVNFDLNDVLGLDEHFSAFGAGTLDGRELVYAGGRLDLPLWAEGTVLSIEAAHSATAPGTATLSSLDFQGTGWTGSIGVTHALIRSIKDNLFVSLGVGYKNLKSRIAATPNSHDKMTVVSAGIDLDSRDRWDGLWHVVANFFAGIDAFNSTPAGDPLSSRAGASGRFVKLEGSVSHLASLSSYTSIYAELAGQVADGPLLVSEQCGYGGANIGRAFDPFEISGDHCVKGRAEVRFDMPTQGRALGDVLKSAQFYVLADFGVMMKSGVLLPSENRTEVAESIGWGWRFKTQNFISGFVEVAHPLDRGIAASGGTRDTRIFFGLAADY